MASVLACGSERGHVTPTAPGAVPVDAVALVGSDAIAIDTVARIARAQGVISSIALDRAISDAVVASAAGDRLGDAAIRQARRGALARKLLESFADDARRKGPPTDDEVAQATAKRWWELDRPRLLRTSHVVVMVKNPDDDAHARALADRIAQRVAGISDPAAFKTAVAAVPAEGLEVLEQDLLPITREGTELDVSSEPPPPPRGDYVKEYVEAAFAIPAIGRQSPVIRTKFGYHVILAVESIPPRTVPLEDRRKMLAEEITYGRASGWSEAALTHARSLDTVAVERSAVDSMLQLRTAP
jgi:hypothetical protein